jgi:hypothetical protein
MGAAFACSDLVTQPPCSTDCQCGHSFVRRHVFHVGGSWQRVPSRDMTTRSCKAPVTVLRPLLGPAQAALAAPPATVAQAFSRHTTHGAPAHTSGSPAIEHVHACSTTLTVPSQRSSHERSASTRCSCHCQCGPAGATASAASRNHHVPFASPKFGATQTVFTAIALVLLSTFAGSAGAVQESERAVLVDLYHATNGTGWATTSRTNWLEGDPCAPPGWYGVVCTGSTTVVYVLYHAPVICCSVTMFI